jgi:hypothetical protein
MLKWGWMVLRVAWCSTSLAYIPPSQFVIKTWVHKHQGSKNLRLKTLVTAIENDKPTGVGFRETLWIHSDNLSFKGIASDDQDRKLFRFERTGGNASLISRLLLSRDVHDVTHQLRGVGIPIRTEDELLRLKTEADRRKAESQSLMRWNSGFSWVIGQPEDSQGQLWIEKDTFLPVKLVYTGAKDGARYELRFENYRFFRDFPYPRVTQLYRNGTWIFSSQLVDLSIEPESVASRGTGLTDMGRSAPSGVKDLMQVYYDVFR